MIKEKYLPANLGNDSCENSAYGGGNIKNLWYKMWNGPMLPAL